MKKKTSMLAAMLIMVSFTFTSGDTEASDLSQENGYKGIVDQFLTTSKHENGYD
ncbi:MULTISPECIES: hypothetical protein [Shouchella]|uniref:Uncharacterized protein n=2 Tax=Shouchella TaxID=2893057 RepID=A0ABY7W9Z6_9BACI|nr:MULTISPECIES: hypothetical protein [Shouchella]MED4130354.1 hypothetical protein [Shouchella miscanthi]WDF04906.1 hypothetical protein PQ477_05440 [Shouchella hunanensis]